MIKQTSKGYWIVAEDTHIGRWCEEVGKLCHDEFLPEIVAKHLKPDMTVIDAGANIGSHSIRYNQILGLKGLIVCVEPGKETFECLQKNAELFAFPKNVYCLQAALGERDGDSCAHVSNENTGASHCEMVFHRVPGSTYLLTVTVDYIRNQIQRKVDFIKMDVEGFEVKVLIGASKCLHEDRPSLLIEVNPGALAKQGDKEQDIYDILTHHKYQYSICQPECSKGSEQYDLLCIPYPIMTLDGLKLTNYHLEVPVPDDPKSS